MRKLIIATALAALSATTVLMSGQSLAQSTPTTPKRSTAEINKAKPSGTLELDAEQIRLLVGGARGKGVLTYQGKQYPFIMKAASVGGVGINKVHAVGDVYFLERLEDFPGTYSAVSAGVTVGAGAGRSQFENDKGALILLRSKTEGVALTLGIGAASVEFVK